MTYRFGRQTRLFKARSSRLTPPRPAGPWPPQAPDLSKFRDKPKPPLGIKSGYCPPDHFWHAALQECIPYKHEVCESPKYWSWQRWANCLYTADPGCTGDSSGIRYMGTEQAIAAGGCVPSECSTWVPTYWSWSAFDCVLQSKPNPYIVPGGISKRSTTRKIRRKGRRTIRKKRTRRRRR